MYGMYNDRIDTTGRDEYSETGFKPNTIVNTTNVLLAGLLTNDTALSGILYLAIGTGNESWDYHIPGVNPGTTALTNEIARIPVPTESIHYIDDNNTPVNDPSGRIEFTLPITLSLDEDVFFREFGVFGGDATTEINSGILINYVIHPAFKYTAGSSLTRTIRFVLRESLPPQNDDTIPAHWLSGVDVIKVDGIKKKLETVLKMNGIATIGDLALTDPLKIKTLIPGNGFEVRTRARMALQVSGRMQVPVGLNDYTIDEICTSTAGDISLKTGLPESNISPVQEAFYLLYTTVSNRFLKKLTIKEFLYGKV